MTRVLVDARMAVRGLGIATFVDRLVDGFAAHPSTSLTLWRSSGQWDARGKLATLARSGPFDLSPRLDPRTRGFGVIHYACNFGSVLPGRNSVLTVHDLMYRQNPRPLHRALGFLLEQSLPRVGRVVAISARTAAALEAAFPQVGGSVEVIPHGLRRLAPPVTERNYILAFGGAADPRKRTDLMVAVYGEYRQTTRDALPLVVLARAGLTDEQGRRLRALEARIVPDASGPEVDRVVAGAAAMLYTTRVEGFGLPIIEAAEVGTPVVMDAAADVAGEVIGDHCIRVTGGRLSDWVAALRDAVCRGPVYDALDLPDWPTVAGRYAELYRRVAVP